jgi:hypothetical protein
MLRAYIGRTFGLRNARILQFLQRSEARLGGTVQPFASAAAFMDCTSQVDRLLCNEIVVSRRDVGHADTAQPVPHGVIFPAAHPDDDVAAPAVTGSLVAAKIRRQRPGPKPYDHLKLYRIILETFGFTGRPSDGQPEILLDDNNLHKIVAAADSKGIKPPGRRQSEFITKHPYSSWAVCLADNKEACRKAIQNRIKWAMRGL